MVSAFGIKGLVALAFCARAGTSLAISWGFTQSKPSTMTAPNSREFNIARTLVELNDAKQVFDFCGGMMFQLALSDKLRTHLANVAEDSAKTENQQPAVFDAAINRMAKIPGYTQNANVDNVATFHGREVRKVATAAGGMGFVLQLVHSEEDPEGWTPQEVDTYDGWGHDAGRVWRTSDRLESEGYTSFKTTFGPEAFTLNHRFYFHLDNSNHLWLAAEDGCEGVYKGKLQDAK